MALAIPPRVLIDTNTLVSAAYRAWKHGAGGSSRARRRELALPGFRFPGNEGRILEAALEGRIRLVLPKVVVVEAREVMRREFPPGAIRALNDLLRGLPFETVPLARKRKLKRYEGVIADPNDLPVLVSAINARPDYVVSGDKHFHTQKVRSLIPVVSARRLVEDLGL